MDHLSTGLLRPTDSFSAIRRNHIKKSIFKKFSSFPFLKGRETPLSNSNSEKAMKNVNEFLFKIEIGFQNIQRNIGG